MSTKVWVLSDMDNLVEGVYSTEEMAVKRLEEIAEFYTAKGQFDLDEWDIQEYEVQ